MAKSEIQKRIAGYVATESTKNTKNLLRSSRRSLALFVAKSEIQKRITGYVATKSTKSTKNLLRSSRRSLAFFVAKSEIRNRNTNHRYGGMYDQTNLPHSRNISHAADGVRRRRGAL